MCIAYRILPEKENHQLTNFLLAMFDCDFEKLPEQFFTSMFFWGHYRHSVAPYVTCMRNRGVNYQEWRKCFLIIREVCPSTIYFSSQRAALCYAAMQVANIYNFTAEPLTNQFITPFVKYKTCITMMTDKVRPCIQLLRNSCLQAPVRAIKTIRLSMDIILDAMRQRSDIKVVHLTRDPRAMVSSRKAIDDFNEKDESAMICSRMLHDLQLTGTLQSYKGRLEIGEKIITTKDTINYDNKNEHYDVIDVNDVNTNGLFRVRYEDLAIAPLSYMQQIYRFMGIEPPTSLATWVRRHSQADFNNGPYGTVRAHGNLNADKWKNSSHSNYLRGLFFNNVNCTKVMSRLNYSE